MALLVEKTRVRETTSNLLQDTDKLCHIELHQSPPDTDKLCNIELHHSPPDGAFYFVLDINSIGQVNPIIT